MTDKITFNTCTTDFTVFDGRQHVLGASILHEISRFADHIFPEVAGEALNVRRAKFMAKIQCNGQIIIADPGSAPIDPEACAASVIARLGDVLFKAWFKPDIDQRVGKMGVTDHKIEDISSHSPFSGQCTVGFRSPSELSLVLVDANKHVQLNSAPLIKRSWVCELAYIENLILHKQFIPFECKLNIRNLANREADGRIYTLNEIAFVDSTNREQSVRIALSFHPKQD